MRAIHAAAPALLVLIFASGCANPGEGLRECAAMPVKGWAELLAKEPFARLSNRRESRFDPLSETSQMLVGDANFSYRVLLTFMFSHPRFSSGRPEERCIRDVSLMLQVPVEGTQAEALSSFLSFLAGKNVPSEIVRGIERARDRLDAFGTVGSFRDGFVAAGVIEQGARGRLFRAEIRSPSPSASERPSGEGAK